MSSRHLPPPRPPGRRTAAPTILLLGVLAVACGGPAPAPLAVGAPMPELSVPLLEGGEIGSEDLRGRPSVLAFWATWCRPCRRDEPVLQALADSGEVAVLAIALDEGSPQVVADTVEERDLRYPVALGDQELFLRFDGFGIPHTVVADAELRVVAVHRGPVELEVLQRELGLAAEAEGDPEPATGSSP